MVESIPLPTRTSIFLLSSHQIHVKDVPQDNPSSNSTSDSVELDLLDDVEDEEITELLDESQYLDDPAGLDDGYNE
eukprot:scaffold57273_cov62-Attheya_sp.AAC.1